MNILPENFSWFLPYLQKHLSLKNLPDFKLLKFSTLELINQSLNPSELLELLLVERFLLENFQNGFYSLNLLKIVLEEKELLGYLIKTKNKINNFTAFKLNEELLFYPLEWGKGTELLNFLWKNKKNFQALKICLKKSFSLENLKKDLKLLTLFDFSFFNENTKRRLENYFPSLDPVTLEEIYRKFLENPLSVLLLSNLEIDSFLNLNCKRLKISSEKSHLYLIEEVNSKFLNSLVVNVEEKGLNFVIGILPHSVFKRFALTELSPLIMVLGTFEHAKRAKRKIYIFDGFTFHIIGDLYLEWKDFGKALKYYKLAESYTKQPVELNLSKAAIYYYLGELEKAEKILRRQLCGAFKEDPLVHYNLGLILSKKKKLEEAKFHFFKAHLLEPQNRIFREALIELLWDIRNLEEMEDILSRIKDLTIKEKAFLGKLYFLKGEYEKAFESLKELLTYSERDGETLLFLAWLYLHLKKEPEISNLLIREAKEKLKRFQFEKILKEFNLKVK